MFAVLSEVSIFCLSSKSPVQSVFYKVTVLYTYSLHPANGVFEKSGVKPQHS